MVSAARLPDRLRRSVRPASPVVLATVAAVGGWQLWSPSPVGSPTWAAAWFLLVVVLGAAVVVGQRRVGWVAGALLVVGAFVGGRLLLRVTVPSAGATGDVVGDLFLIGLLAAAATGVGAGLFLAPGGRRRWIPLVAVPTAALGYQFGFADPGPTAEVWWFGGAAVALVAATVLANVLVGQWWDVPVTAVSFVLGTWSTLAGQSDPFTGAVMIVLAVMTAVLVGAVSTGVLLVRRSVR